MSDNAWSPSDDQVKAIWELWRRQPEGSPGFAFADIRFHLETAARLGIVTPAPLPESAQAAPHVFSGGSQAGFEDMCSVRIAGAICGRDRDHAVHAAPPESAQAAPLMGSPEWLAMMVSAVEQFRRDHPEEYAAIVKRNEEAWAACRYYHGRDMLCNKCGWSDFESIPPESAQSIHKHTPACNPFTDEVNPNPGFCLEGVKLNVL